MPKSASKVPFALANYAFAESLRGAEFQPAPGSQVMAGCAG